jgi:basic membrane protein A
MNRIAISRMTATLIVIIIVIAIGAAVYFTLPPSTTTSSSTTTSLSTTTTTTKKPIKIGVIFDIGGRGDLSFNDMAWLGAERAKRDFNVSITYLQSRSQADYVPNLRQLASSGDYALIICIGFLMTDALNQTASEFPNQKFAIIDSIVNKPNVRSILFKENEGSALIGALAGLITQTNKVGVVLGIEIPVLWRFEAGYYWGINYAANLTGKKITILYKYTNTFTDAAVGRAVTEGFLAQGVDVVYNVAGLTGKGMLDAVYDYGVQHGKQIGPPFGVGVDADQDWIHPGFVIASMMKRVDNGVYYAIRDVVYGNFTGGIQFLGLKEGGVKMSDRNDLIQFIDIAKQLGAQLPDTPDNIIAKYDQMRNSIPSSVWQTISDLESKIKSGQLKVPLPTTHDEIQAIRLRYGATG